MPVEQLVNPQGAYGYTAGEHGGRLVGYYEASAAITKGEVVSIGTNGKVAKSATNGDVNLVIGVALETISADKVGPIAMKGVVQDVKTDGGDDIAAGDLLRRSATTAGTVDSFTVDDTNRSHEAFAVAIDADVDAGNTVDIYIF